MFGLYRKALKSLLLDFEAELVFSDVAGEAVGELGVGAMSTSTAGVNTAGAVGLGEEVMPGTATAGVPALSVDVESVEFHLTISCVANLTLQYDYILLSQ
jgi:hypothetical protein